MQEGDPKLQNISVVCASIVGADYQSATTGRIRIREAVAKDIDSLLEIEFQCFSSGPYRHHKFDRSQYRYYLRNPKAVNLLAVRGGVSIASLVAIAGRGVRSGSGRILSIAVVRSERRRGIGLRLLTHALISLRARGCERIYLEIAEHAKPAEALFRSAGYITVRRLPNYYGRSVHGKRMMLTPGLPRT